MIIGPRQVVVALGASASVLAMVACGETASTSKFSGESHNVAQTVSNFQTDATAADEKKLCQDDFAATLSTRLRKAGGCQSAVKNQLRDMDAPSMTIEAVKINGTGAIAHVKSTYSGKSRITTLTLVREGSHWKISGVGPS